MCRPISLKPFASWAYVYEATATTDRHRASSFIDGHSALAILGSVSAIVEKQHSDQKRVKYDLVLTCGLAISMASSASPPVLNALPLLRVLELRVLECSIPRDMLALSFSQLQNAAILVAQNSRRAYLPSACGLAPPAMS